MDLQSTPFGHFGTYPDSLEGMSFICANARVRKGFLQSQAKILQNTALFRLHLGCGLARDDLDALDHDGVHRVVVGVYRGHAEGVQHVQPLRDMAGTATRMLLDLARGLEPSTSRVDLVTELVVRESTAPMGR